MPKNGKKTLTDLKSEGTEIKNEDTAPKLSDDKVRELLVAPMSTGDDWYYSYKEIYERLENLYFLNLSYNSEAAGSSGRDTIGNPNAKNLPTQYSTGQAHQIVETILPRLIQGKTRPDIAGQEESDEPGAKMNEKLMDFQMEQDRLDAPLEAWIRQATKTIGVLKVDLKVEEIKYQKKKRKYEMKIPMMNKTVGVGGLKTVEEVKQKFTHILETVPYEDLIIGRGTDNDTVPFIGIKLTKTVQEMEDDGRYKKMDEAEKVQSTGFDLDEWKAERESQQDIDQQNLNDMLVDREVELQEIYYKYEGSMYLVTFTKEGMIIVRNEALDFWHGKYPVRVLSLIPVENQAIGLSPLQVTEGQINMFDDWMNIILSVAMFDIMRPTVYNKKMAGINWQKNPPIYAPGMAYPMNDVDALKVLPAPTLLSSHFEIYGLLKQTIQNTIGVTDYISGTDTVKEDKTLGEVRLKTAQSNKRFDLTIKHLRRKLSDVFEMMVSNNQQYLPDDYPIRIFGDEGRKWEKVGAESIQGKFDYRIRGFENIIVEEERKVQKYWNMIKIGLQLNQGGQPLVNIPYLTNKLYGEGFGSEDVDKIVIPPQETLQADDQTKKAQAQKADQENKNPERAVIRPDDDHAVHMDVHTAFIQSKAFEQLSDQLKNALARHIQSHRQVMAQGQQNQQPRPPEQTPPVQKMVRPKERQVKYQ